MKNNWNKFTDKFGDTIFHPQFIILSYKKNAIKEALKYSKGKNFIDIGCGRMEYRKLFTPIVKSYTGVDHPEISKLYNSEIAPEILCDITKKIPVKNNNYDIAIMFEVLEYLENPIKTFSEIHRLLKKNAILILTSPFLYPLHDIPFDRNRFTETQIKSFLKKTGFKIIKLKPQGNFIGFLGQSINVFLLKRIMDIIKSKKNIVSICYLVILTIFTPFIVIFSNLLFLITKNFQAEKYINYFPLDYLFVATKE